MLVLKINKSEKVLVRQKKNFVANIFVSHFENFSQMVKNRDRQLWVLFTLKLEIYYESSKTTPS